MRVLHVITGLDAGGAEHQLRLLLQHLPFECEVATLTNSGAVARAIRSHGTPVHDLGMRHNRDLPVLSRLTELMQRGGYDLVHTHLYRACLYGRVAARLAGVPHIVATEHSLGDSIIEGRPVSGGIRRLYLRTERRTDATIAVSTAVARRLLAWGVPAERIVVIPNGIEANEFRFDPALRESTRARLGIGRHDYVVGAVGRLEPTKRLDVLVRAVAGIDGAILLVVGDGPERHALQELAQAEGVVSRVRFAGETSHVRAELCAMDVLASPSPAETFGLAVLEGLACGLPVVYVSCPALDELPPQTAPGARKLPLDVTPFRSTLAAQSTRDRLPPPAAVARYDMARLAAEVADLYRRVQAGQPANQQPDALMPDSPPAQDVIAAPAGPVTQPAPSRAVPPEESTMPSPSQVLRRLVAQVLLLVLAVLIGAGLGALYAKTRSPSYQASAYVVVSPVSQSGDDTTAVNFAQAYGRIVTQDVVLARAAATLGRRGSVDVLRRQVRVSTSPDAPLIQLTASAGAPTRAADLANAVATALVDYAGQRRLQTRVRLDSFAEASPPSGPASPNLTWDILVGAAAGLLLGGLAITAGVGRRIGAGARHEDVDVDAVAAARADWKSRSDPSVSGSPAAEAGIEEPEPFLVPRPRADGHRPDDTQPNAAVPSSVDADTSNANAGRTQPWGR